MIIKNKEIIALKKRLKKDKIQGLALDIDETLSFTIGFLVENLSKKIGNPEKLTAKEVFLKYRHTKDVPYWQNVESEKIVDEIINSNERQKEMPLIENSSDIVAKINKIIPIVAYITNRPSLVRGGTNYWLKKNGFVKARVIMRPKNVNKKFGNKWKAGVLNYLYPQVLGIVDDSVGMLEYLNKYKGKMFLYGVIDFKKRTKVKTIPCRDWENVLKNIKGAFNGGSG
jgi:hypothetical protein